MGYDDLFGTDSTENSDSSQRCQYLDSLPWWAEEPSSGVNGHARFSTPPYGNGTIEISLKTAAIITLLLDDQLQGISEKQLRLIRRSFEDTINAAEFKTAKKVAEDIIRNDRYYREDIPDDALWKYIELLHPYTKESSKIKRAYLLLTGPSPEDVNGLNDNNKDDNSGFVYLAYAETQDYKIGRSKNPDDRIKHFDTQMPVEVSKVHTFPATDANESERLLHEWCEDRQVKGEWFNLEEQHVDVLKAISEFEDGAFIRAKDGAQFNKQLKTILK